jgi:hypothetical protein
VDPVGFGPVSVAALVPNSRVCFSLSVHGVRLFVFELPACMSVSLCWSCLCFVCDFGGDFCSWGSLTFVVNATHLVSAFVCL